MARIAFGNANDGTGFWVRSDMVMKETNVRRMVNGSPVYDRILWFPDGSQIRLTGSQITTYDATAGS